jgi:L-aminopeptidase/D-esterase-like protein
LGLSEPEMKKNVINFIEMAKKKGVARMSTGGHIEARKSAKVKKLKENVISYIDKLAKECGEGAVVQLVLDHFQNDYQGTD